MPFTNERASENQRCSNPKSGLDLGATLKFHMPSRDRVSLNVEFFGYRVPYCAFPSAVIMNRWTRRTVIIAKAKRGDGK